MPFTLIISRSEELGLRKKKKKKGKWVVWVQKIVIIIIFLMALKHGLTIHIPTHAFKEIRTPTTHQTPL